MRRRLRPIRVRRTETVTSHSKRAGTAADTDTAIASFFRVAGLYPGSDAEPFVESTSGPRHYGLSRRNDESLDRYRDLTLAYPRSIWSARALLGAASCLCRRGGLATPSKVCKGSDRVCRHAGGCDGPD